MAGPAAAVHSRRVAWATLALVAILAVPAPGLAQSAGSIAIDAQPSSAVTVNLRSDAGKAMVFTLHESDFEKAQGANSLAVHLARTGSGDVLYYAAQRDSQDVWTVSVPVDTVDLVAGDWTVSYFAVKSAGAVLVKQRALTVALSDTDAPKLDVLPLGDPIRLGPGDALEIQVEEEFLRSVTLSREGLPQALKLAAPYRLSVDAFPEGLNNVTVIATDRAGHVSRADVKVDRDTLAPSLAVSAPEVAYTGVPFAIAADVTERSQHTVRMTHNASSEARTGAATAGNTTTSHVFVATVDEVGDATFAIEAVDLVGNRVSSIFTVPVVQPPTDVRAVSLSLAPGPTPLVGRPVDVVATLEQVGGVTSLPVTVTFSSGGKQQAMTVTLPAVGTKLVAWNVTLSPGLREVSVHVEGPPFANETNPGNENATATVETFLGTSRAFGDLYYIRADSRGLPAFAVEDGTGKAYALKLLQTGRGVAYEFTLPGNRTGVWDPLTPIAPEPAKSSTSSSSTTTDSKGAAAPGLVMALAVVALAALAQRRRL
jgi:MYXO-CTERM domain-containing protein